MGSNGGDGSWMAVVVGSAYRDGGDGFQGNYRTEQSPATFRYYSLSGQLLCLITNKYIFSVFFTSYYF